MNRRLSNTTKTVGLFALMWAILLALGAAISAGTNDSLWLWIFAGMGVISTFVTYWNSATLALKQMNAYPVTREAAPGLYAIVEDLTSRAGMPMPSIWIAPTQNPNAFATGRNPQNAAVCCTEGILQVLDERELRGVLGHELMHVYNRDILTSSVAAAMAGLITSLAQWALLFGGRDRDRGAGFPAIIAALAAPMIASIVQLGISRSREYDADEDGALLTNDPVGLAMALNKIDNLGRQAPMERTPDRESASAMMIANPFRGKDMTKLFSTHPPMEDRIARLHAMQEEMNQQ
ncbi:M48 family metalloprotease [Schaalia sp. JY-X169]|jgi:heat shock protein HtpX|uniref:M48 family metalloprotease n=1 Tax=Schaalia sp. JY-X169 TaxID=2758572 RepID=UPI0021755697|nr:M48 family metalloprotease [Schaalia sp. JY-X169]